MSLPRGVVWITGASSGIGYYSALKLAKSGWLIAASARNKKRLKELASKHKNISIYPLDVSNPIERREVYKKLRADLGPVDVLVNNAGLGSRGAVEEIDLSDMRHIYDVNVFAPVELTKLVLPEMRERRLGRIIMVSSVVGRITPPLNGVYSSSKFAIEALSDALRKEVCPWDIKVSLIEPGPIATEFATIAKSRSKSRYTNDNSPYKEYYNNYFNKGYYKRRTFWGPATCAEAIRDAAENPKPKTRYPVHPIAVWMPILKKILPTRLFDSILSKPFGFKQGNILE